MSSARPAASSPSTPVNDRTLVYLQELARLYPSPARVLARIARWEAELTLPKETIHIISDIHGDYLKLRHVINNASGYIRPLIDQLFSESLSRDERLRFLNLIYYPAESYARLSSGLSPDARTSLVEQMVTRQLVVIRALARRYPIEQAESVFPQELASVIEELLDAPYLGRSPEFMRALLEPYLETSGEIELIRSLSRLIRNLSVSELIIAGDFGDRGPRIDRTIDYVIRQPRVRITWGNHDVSWMGACLGSRVCIATVVRISLRYQRIEQLEEGYGIPLTPLEDLVNAHYLSDEAKCFKSKGAGARDALALARMQKAIAVIQFKLEGQAAKRNPHLDLSDRLLLERCDFAAGTVSIHGTTYPLRDTFFPTIDPRDPYALNAAEQACVDALQASFLFSPRLWAQMKYLAEHGTMYLVRDNHLIFHACVPCSPSGDFLPLIVDGEALAGRVLFDRLHSVVQRAFRERREPDLDLLWYLWGGPRSPLFGKDKMTTFETYLIEDPATHREEKNPYFSLIHEADFCEKVLREFGANPELGLIVNGHVPVKIEKGESPLKRSGKAVTIDGAFSEAYGDRGYTLVLSSEGTALAQHHHFSSVREALENGTDIVPSIEVIRHYPDERKVRDTERGEYLRHHIAILRGLLEAYRDNRIRQR